MTNEEYLRAVLDSHTLTSDDPGLKDVLARADEVEALLNDQLEGHSPLIERAGSLAKGTMISDSYDVDLSCYFHRDTDFADTLEGIYEGVAAVLDTRYITERNRSSLKLWVSGDLNQLYTRIDVVPGRFVNGDDGDVFLHQNQGDKQRLQTNLNTHVTTIRNSGVRSAIRLLKVWREVSGLDFKTFVMELLVMDILTGMKAEPLDAQVRAVLDAFAEEIESLTPIDPANSNNDLSPIFNEDVKDRVSDQAQASIHLIDSVGWGAVFGDIDVDDRAERLRRAAPAVIVSPGSSKPGYRPWARVR